MTKPKARLKNLKLQRWSFVDDGDNPGAHILLAKRNEEQVTEEKKKGLLERLNDWVFTEKMPNYAKTTMEIVEEREKFARFNELRDAYMVSLDSIMSDELSEESLGMLTKSTEEFVSGIRAFGDQMLKNNPEAFEQLDNIAKTFETSINPESWQTEKGRVDFAECVSKLESFEPKVTPEQPKEESEKMTVETAQAQAQEGTEKMNDDVMKRMEALEKRFAEANKAREEAEKRAAELEEQATVAKYKQQAEDLGVAGVDNDVVAKAIRLADETGDSATLETIKALAEQAKNVEALTTSIGTAKSNDSESGDKVEAAVKSIQKENPEMTYHQAYSEALARNPALYTESQQ